jgi:hypothetical protein
MKDVCGIIWPVRHPFTIPEWTNILGNDLGLVDIIIRTVKLGL